MPKLVVMTGQQLTKLRALRLDWIAQGQLAALYQNDQTPAPGQTAADYLAAVYDGATQLPVVWSNLPIVGEPGEGVMIGESLIWTPASAGVGCDVYGYFVVSTREPGVLIYAQRFDGALPLRIGDTLAPITVVPVWREKSIP